MPVPVAVRSMARVYGRSVAGTAGSNPAGGTYGCPLWVLCVLSGRCLCDGLITRPEKSYRLWCVLVYDLGTSRMRRLKLVKRCKCRIEEEEEAEVGPVGTCFFLQRSWPISRVSFGSQSNVWETVVTSTRKTRTQQFSETSVCDPAKTRALARITSLWML